MKHSLGRTSVLSIVLACGLFATPGCTSPSAAQHEALAASMKGWELYSWPVDGGAWRFALLGGTNRAKTVDEIREPGGELHGVDELLAQLDRLPAGEFVTWCAPRAPGDPGHVDTFPLPPPPIVDTVVARAKTDKLVLSVP
jgi:hypothetical protein